MDTLDIIDGFSYSLNPWNGSISETLFPGLLNISGDSPFANSESVALGLDGCSGALIEANGLSGGNIPETGISNRAATRHLAQHAARRSTTNVHSIGISE